MQVHPKRGLLYDDVYFYVKHWILKYKYTQIKYALYTPRLSKENNRKKEMDY